MEFISDFLKLKPFFKTEKEVQEARIILQKSTEKLFADLRKAKINSWLRSHKIILD